MSGRARGSWRRRPPEPGARSLREWGRIGCIGFGGPPAHIALLRDLCVERRRWLGDREFEDAIAATQPAARPGVDPAGDLLRLAAARPRRRRSSAALGFIVPGLVADPRARRRCSSPARRRPGCSAPAPAPAPPSPRSPCSAGASLVARELGRAPRRPSRAGSPTCLAGAGWPRRRSAPGWSSSCSPAALVEVVARRAPAGDAASGPHPWPLLAAAGVGERRAARAGLGGVQGRRALLRRRVRDHPADAGTTPSTHYHWMTDAPVPQRRRARPGHARPGRAHGRRRRLRRRRASAAGCSPPPSRSRHRSRSSWSAHERFDRLRASPSARAFLDGAGPAAIGAIVGAAIPLALAARRAWQFAVLAAAAVALLVAAPRGRARRSSPRAPRARWPRRCQRRSRAERRTRLHRPSRSTSSSAEIGFVSRVRAAWEAL